MSDQIYYHFLSSKHAIHDLERKMIRVSLIDTLNDPFELLPYLGQKDSEQRKLYYNIRKIVSKEHGLLCFSQCWNEPLLWGHYADKHKGIALGFKISKYKILEVIYRQERVKLLLRNEVNLDKQHFLDILTKIKYQNWSYEKEYRVLVDLKDCILIDGHHFIKFGDSLTIKEIILGCKYDNSEEYVLKLSKEFDAKVIPSREAFKSYQIVRHGSKIKRFQKMLNSLNS